MHCHPYSRPYQLARLPGGHLYPLSGEGQGAVDYVVSEVNNGHFPASVDKCDAYLVSGSVNGTYDDQPRIGELMQFVRSGDKAGIKLVGICFGHQLLAHALAGLAGNGRALPGKRSS